MGKPGNVLIVKTVGRKPCWTTSELMHVRILADLRNGCHEEVLGPPSLMAWGYYFFCFFFFFLNRLEKHLQRMSCVLGWVVLEGFSRSSQVCFLLTYAKHLLRSMASSRKNNRPFSALHFRGRGTSWQTCFWVRAHHRDVLASQRQARGELSFSLSPLTAVGWVSWSNKLQMMN